MVDEVDVYIGRRVRRRRRLLGLTQQQLAIACGVRFQQIQKYECGANRVSAARIWRLSRALDVPVAYFFDGLEPAPVEDSVALGADGADMVSPFKVGGESSHRRLLDLTKSLHGSDAA